jgi:hypothetical protein
MKLNDTVIFQYQADKPLFGIFMKQTLRLNIHIQMTNTMKSILNLQILTWIVPHKQVLHNSLLALIKVLI